MLRAETRALEKYDKFICILRYVLCRLNKGVKSHKFIRHGHYHNRRLHNSYFEKIEGGPRGILFDPNDV